MPCDGPLKQVWYSDVFDVIYIVNDRGNPGVYGGMAGVWPYLYNITSNYLKNLYHSWTICVAIRTPSFLSHTREIAFNRKVKE